MVRTLLRVVLLIIIVAAVAAFFFGYRMANRDESEPTYTVGTSGRNDRTVDVGTARETGAEIAEKVAVGANAAERFAQSAALTAKIKSKMALDDTVQAARIDVDTSGNVVTLSGTVASSAPFIGLLGTVVGIIKSFESMAIAGTGGFAVVAAGISEALVATALGLGIAIIAVIFYNYFQTRIGTLNGLFRIQVAKVLRDLGA